MKKNINLTLVSLNLFSLFVIFSINGCKRNPGVSSNNGKDNSRILIKGSDTEYQMVKFMAGQYATGKENVFVHVTDGGSGVGITAFINGEVDIANSSRAMTAEEYKIAEKNGIRPLQIMFAIDAVSVITNSKLGIDSLSLRQVGQIFGGEITNWKELGGPDAPIHLFGRDNTSGTYQYFKDKFVRDNYAEGMSHLRGNTEIVKAVENDLHGIGYTGIGYLMADNEKPRGNVWAMPVYIEGQKACSPYEVKAVYSGEYPVTRPLYQYINSAHTDLITDFILFELSGKGQQLVRRFGYFPINDYQKEINRVKGLVLN